MKTTDVRVLVMFAVALLPTSPVALKAAAPSNPETVRIGIDASQPRWQISNYLTGMHFVYAKEPDALYRDPRIVDWMRRARVGIIRWPGGTAVQTYHWDQLNGIAFKEDSWDPKHHAQPAAPSEYMDLDEYIAFCRRVGAEPMVGINIGSGKRFGRQAQSLDEARRLITYCKRKDYRVKHWYIGNECYKGWGAAAYAKAIDLYARQLRAVDPNIVIIGDWKFGPEQKKRFEELLLIARTSREVNVMEVHEKWGNKWGLNAGNSKATVAAWQQQAGLYDGHFAAYIERFLRAMKRAGKDVRLGFNEWGVELRGDATPFHVALVKADYVVTLFQHPVYSACDWNLNMGPGKSRILLTGDGGHSLAGFSPSAQIFVMCAPALGQRSLPLKSSHPLVYGFAATGTGSGDIQVWLLNKRSEAVLATFELPGADVSTAGLKAESFVQPGKLQPAEPVSSQPGAGPSLRLAPLSFTYIRISPGRAR